MERQVKQSELVIETCMRCLATYRWKTEISYNFVAFVYLYLMEESKRQKQVGKLVQQEMSDIFQREGMSIVDGGMISIAKVSVTPDLMEARIYLSLFQVKDSAALLKEIKERTGEWRNLLGQRVKNQLRRVPELQFFIDDTLDYVFRMEEVFKKIQDERDAKNPPANNPSE